MPAALNLKDRTFGALLVVRRVGVHPGGSVLWLCRCACRAEVEVTAASLTRGKRTSCGCKRVAGLVARTAARCTKHGQNRRGGRSREYAAWRGMKTRCLNSKHASFHYYGGRGIKVCARWLASFDAFFADMGRCPKNRSLDRKNNDGNYEPGNCRWATKKQQSANRRPWGSARPARPSSRTASGRP
jgi:hypothetical protein